MAYAHALTLPSVVGRGRPVWSGFQIRTAALIGALFLTIIAPALPMIEAQGAAALQAELAFLAKARQNAQALSYDPAFPLPSSPRGGGGAPTGSYTYGTTVLGDSPTAYWPCDDGTGSSCRDATGNGHTASFVCVYPANCSTSLPTWASIGLVGGSPYSVTCCSGSTTCCNVGANAASPFGLPAARSVEAVYSCSNPSNCGAPTLFDANGTEEMRLGISSSTGIVGSSGGQGGTCSTTANLYDGFPHLIDLIDDGTHVNAYIDAATCFSVSSINTADTSVTCVRIIVLCNNGYSINTGDDLGQVSVYGTALTTTQITNHYNAAFLPGAVTNLVATGSTSAASLSWTAPTYQGWKPITSYSVTPVVDGLAGQPLTVSGQGNGANIPNLPGGSSYTFKVQAVNARGGGPSTTSNAATINSPSAGPGGFHNYLYLRGGPSNGQAFASYGLVSRNNAPALSNWTIEARLWGFTSLATTGSHMALGYLSGTTSNPSDQNPVSGLDFQIGGSSNLKTYFVWPGGSCVLPSDSSGIASAFNAQITTPAHVALTYDGTTIRGFINGTLVSGCSVATSSAALSASPFGFMDNDGLAQGYFDEIRVSSTARWTANFTPATQQYTPDSSTSLLWHLNDYAITKLPVIDIPANVPGYPVSIQPSAFHDATSNLNHANIVWHSGSSSVNADFLERAYSLGQGVTADELTGGGSPWLCPCTAYQPGYPINDETGEFYHTFNDFSIPGRVPLVFSRTYSSLRTTYFGPLGFGWTDSYNQYLSFDGSGNATVHASNGSAVLFTFTSPSTYTGPPSEHAALVKNGDGSFTLTDTGLNQTVFNAASGGVSTLQKMVDRHGGTAYTLSFTYNADGTLKKVTDPASRTLTFAYTTIGSAKLIQTIADTFSPARSVTFAYGTNSNDATTYQSLTQVTDVAGGLTKFTYDSSHYMQAMTDPNNGVVTNTYDPGSHKITNQQDPLHRNTTFSYSNGTTTITDPKGNVTTEEYLNGILMSRTVGYGTAQAATWTYSFDGSALALTAAVGPNGQTMTTVRDASANVLSSTDGQGRATSYTYNSFNEPLTVKDPLGVTTTNVYNSTGDLTSSSRPLVGTGNTQTTSYTYGDSAHVGDVTKMTDPDSNAFNYTYDTYGDKASSTDPLGDKTTYFYDSIGRMTSMVTPNGNVTGGHPTQFTWSYTYDNFGNRLTVTDPLSHKTTYHYDPNQNLDKVTDPLNNVTTNVYDLDNELTTVKRADSPQTSLVTDYNSDGTVLDQKDGKGNAIQSYTYDSLARVATVTDALGNVTTYTYDGNGNQLTKQQPGGNCAAVPATGCTSYTYDSANQLLGISYSDGVTPNVSAITYDLDGQRTGMTDGTGSSSWGWDSLHRLVSYQNGNGVSVAWIYNLRSLPTTITYPGSNNVTEGYDNAGRWTSVKDWNLNQTTFGYDANSNLTAETLPSGTGVVDTFGFDNADNLSSISDAKGSTNLFSATYTRDSANQLLSDTSASTNQTNFKYTPLNQLCYAGSGTSSACSSPPSGSLPYAYDAADNLTHTGTTQQVFNAADELCWTASTSSACGTPPSGAITYSYDTRGNRTAVTPSAGQAQAFSYDQANRMTSYAAASTTTYAYNGDGLRMSKTSGGTTTQYLWDPSGGMPLLLKDGTMAYIYGPGGLPLEQIAGSTTSWLHHDQIGSTRLITSSTGSSVATYRYDSYGNLVASSGTITDPLKFAGQYQDAESGLYYLRARYYDPTTGQFVTLDPAVASTRAPFGYVAGNPLNIADPSGRSQACGAGGCGGMCTPMTPCPGNYPPDKSYDYFKNAGDFLAQGATWTATGAAAAVGAPLVFGPLGLVVEPFTLPAAAALGGTSEALGVGAATCHWLGSLGGNYDSYKEFEWDLTGVALDKLGGNALRAYGKHVRAADEPINAAKAVWSALTSWIPNPF